MGDYKDNKIAEMFGLNPSSDDAMLPARVLISNLTRWLRTNQEAQVMICGVGVAFAIWFVARALISLVFSLLGPLLIAFAIMLCMPSNDPMMGVSLPQLQRAFKEFLLHVADKL